MRKRKKGSGGGSEAGVSMTPLIDCVFLLLIFFLVTSMIKRYERLIPVTLADPMAAVAAHAEEDVYQLAIGNDGRFYAQAGRGAWGSFEFAPVDDIDEFLDRLLADRGNADAIQVRVDRKVSFQTVIRYQDLLELRSFRNVRFRVSDRGSELGG